MARRQLAAKGSLTLRGYKVFPKPRDAAQSGGNAGSPLRAGLAVQYNLLSTMQDSYGDDLYVHMEDRVCPSGTSVEETRTPHLNPSHYYCFLVWVSESAFESSCADCCCEPTGSVRKSASVLPLTMAGTKLCSQTSATAPTAVGLQALRSLLPLLRRRTPAARLR